MFTFNRWTQFWRSLFTGVFRIVLIGSLFCALLSLGFRFNPTFIALLQDVPWQVIGSALFTSISYFLSKALFAAFVLQALIFVLPQRTQIFASFFFIFLLITRASLLHPDDVDSWPLFQTFSTVRSFRNKVLLWLQEHDALGIVDWSPMTFFIFLAILSFFTLVIHLFYQTEKYSTLRRGLLIEDLDRESKRLAMGAVGFVLFLSACLFGTESHQPSDHPTYAINNNRLVRPNIFLIGVENFDEVLAAKASHKTGELSLTELVEDFAYHDKLLLGIPSGFPAWYEIATCRYSPAFGRSIDFPSTQDLSSEPPTLFKAAQDAGYLTAYFSNSNEGVFSRHPFPADKKIAGAHSILSLVNQEILHIFPVAYAQNLMPTEQNRLTNALGFRLTSEPLLILPGITDTLSSHSHTGKPVLYSIHIGLSFSKKEEGTSSHTQNSQILQTQETLTSLWKILKEGDWLQHSIVVFFGLPPKNTELVSKKNIFGHYAVSSERHTQKVYIGLFGSAETNFSTGHVNRSLEARTIDLAPTISRRATIPWNYESCEGIPLLDTLDKEPAFPVESAYQESPLPSSQSSFYQVKRGELEIDPVWRESLSSLRERAWIKGEYRLVIRQSEKETKTLLFHRYKDPKGQKNLLETVDYTSSWKTISENLQAELDDYLEKNGEKRISTSPKTYFYIENQNP